MLPTECINYGNNLKYIIGNLTQTACDNSSRHYFVEGAGQVFDVAYPAVLLAGIYLQDYLSEKLVAYAKRTLLPFSRDEYSLREHVYRTVSDIKQKPLLLKQLAGVVAKVQVIGALLATITSSSGVYTFTEKLITLKQEVFNQIDNLTLTLCKEDQSFIQEGLLTLRSEWENAVKNYMPQIRFCVAAAADNKILFSALTLLALGILFVSDLKTHCKKREFSVYQTTTSVFAGISLFVLFVGVYQRFLVNELNSEENLFRGNWS